MAPAVKNTKYHKFCPNGATSTLQHGHMMERELLLHQAGRSQPSLHKYQNHAMKSLWVSIRASPGCIQLCSVMGCSTQLSCKHITLRPKGLSASHGGQGSKLSSSSALFAAQVVKFSPNLHSHCDDAGTFQSTMRAERMSAGNEGTGEATSEGRAGSGSRQLIVHLLCRDTSAE